MSVLVNYQATVGRLVATNTDHSGEGKLAGSQMQMFQDEAYSCIDAALMGLPCQRVQEAFSGGQQSPSCPSLLRCGKLLECPDARSGVHGLLSCCIYSVCSNGQGTIPGKCEKRLQRNQEFHVWTVVEEVIGAGRKGTSQQRHHTPCHALPSWIAYIQVPAVSQCVAHTSLFMHKLNSVRWGQNWSLRRMIFEIDAKEKSR